MRTMIQRVRGQFHEAARRWAIQPPLADHVLVATLDHGAVATL